MKPLLAALLCTISFAFAADYPAPQEGSWVVRDFKFHTGEVLEAVLVAINSADDERNPPELGVLDREIKRVKSGRVLLIPGSKETSGHGTTGRARFYKDELAKLLASAPRRGQ
ncbi:MAG TPA: hypothetical protein VFZ94_07365 [Burkholderiales bacterium]